VVEKVRSLKNFFAGRDILVLFFSRPLLDVLLRNSLVTVFSGLLSFSAIVIIPGNSSMAFCGVSCSRRKIFVSPAIVLLGLSML